MLLSEGSSFVGAQQRLQHWRGRLALHNQPVLAVQPGTHSSSSLRPTLGKGADSLIGCGKTRTRRAAQTMETARDCAVKGPSRKRRQGTYFTFMARMKLSQKNSLESNFQNLSPVPHIRETSKPKPRTCTRRCSHVCNQSGKTFANHIQA